jgi:PAS domain S-box-containing protein
LEALGKTARVCPPAAINDELFRLLVQSVKDYAIFLLDPTGHVASWNEGAQRIKGYAATEIIGKHFSVFYPEAAISIGWPEYELKMAALEGRFEDEAWRLRKDGSRFWADVVITAVRDETGTLRGFAKVTRDLTERKMAEETVRLSEERYRMLVEHVRDYAIFMLDLEGRVITWNSGAQKLKGYHADEIIGKHFSCFYTPEDLLAGWPDRELEIAREEGSVEHEGWRVRKDGSHFWANVVLTAVYNRQGELQGFSKVTRDMTERRRFEENTRQLNSELQVRVDELAETNRTLAEKSDENETFVYSVSHDVRGPLVNLQGFSHELQRSGEELARLIEGERNLSAPVRERALRIVNEDMAESIRFMRTAVIHLSNIIDALLRLSRLGRVVYQQQEVDVAAIVRRIADSLRDASGRQCAEIVVNDLPPVSADSAAIEQVFNNLIGNALRYSDPSRPCCVVIGGAPSENGRSIVYYVKDNGLGIPQSAIPKLFTAFRRFHPDVAPGEGTGLAAVRRIVDRHHGTIRVESKEGEGSTFYIELPAGGEDQ